MNTPENTVAQFCFAAGYLARENAHTQPEGQPWEEWVESIADIGSILHRAVRMAAFNGIDYGADWYGILDEAAEFALENPTLTHDEYFEAFTAIIKRRAGAQEA